MPPPATVIVLFQPRKERTGETARPLSDMQRRPAGKPSDILDERAEFEADSIDASRRSQVGQHHQKRMFLQVTPQIRSEALPSPPMLDDVRRVDIQPNPYPVASPLFSLPDAYASS
jgi:hypothetical protein